MNSSQMEEYQTYKRLRWTNENGRQLYEIYFTPLMNCVEYLQWRARDNYLMKVDTYDEDYENDIGCLEKLYKMVCCKKE